MEFVQKVIGRELDTFEGKSFLMPYAAKRPYWTGSPSSLSNGKASSYAPCSFSSAPDCTARSMKAHAAPAALVELLHTATLVHDDVVDESMEKEVFFSINAVWKNKIAVLVGDYLLSKGAVTLNFE